MTRALCIAAVFAAAIGALVWYLARTHDIHTFYGGSLRSSLFSGFLSLGGFLLSLKTFIVVKMKEGLYDHRLYKERFAEWRKKDARRATAKLFEPLGRLRGLLFLSIVSALVTAVLQMTLGLVEKDWAAGVCLAATGFSIALLTQSLIQINGNLRTWFGYLEEDADEQEREAEKKRVEAEQKEKNEVQKPPPAQAPA